jgi:hypothetical protein
MFWTTCGLGICIEEFRIGEKDGSRYGATGEGRWWKITLLAVNGAFSFVRKGKIWRIITCEMMIP